MTQRKYESYIQAAKRQLRSQLQGFRPPDEDYAELADWIIETGERLRVVGIPCLSAESPNSAESGAHHPLYERLP